MLQELTTNATDLIHSEHKFEPVKGLILWRTICHAWPRWSGQLFVFKDETVPQWRKQFLVSICIRMHYMTSEASGEDHSPVVAWIIVGSSPNSPCTTAFPTYFNFKLFSKAPKYEQWTSCWNYCRWPQKEKRRWLKLTPDPSVIRSGLVASGAEACLSQCFKLSDLDSSDFDFQQIAKTKHFQLGSPNSEALWSSTVEWLSSWLMKPDGLIRLSGISMITFVYKIEVYRNVHGQR